MKDFSTNLDCLKKFFCSLRRCVNNICLTMMINGRLSRFLKWLNNVNYNRVERRSSRFLHTAPRTVSNTYAQMARVLKVCKSCAIHRAFITCSMPCAIWYKGTAQLLSLTEFKSHFFFFLLYFIGWTINRWRRGGNQSNQRKPPMISFRKYHILKSPKWASNQHSGIGGRLGKQTC